MLTIPNMTAMRLATLIPGLIFGLVLGMGQPFAAEVTSAAEVPTPLNNSQAAGKRQRFDPYNPAMLNEAAMQKIRDRDYGGAAILLERAVLLAPYDKRIEHNLQILHAWQAGKPATAAPANGKSTEAIPPSEDVMTMPVPIWRTE